jgi:hypothetical protein
MFLQLPDLYADTIYSWTDKNGTKKHSNTAPEEDVEHLEVIEEMPLSETSNTDIEVDEEGFGQADRELEVDNRISELKTEQQQIKNKIPDGPLNEKIQAEKIRLLEQIDRIEKLAVGRSLSLARKNAMIKQFRDKLDLLERSPEEYFSVSETE